MPEDGDHLFAVAIFAPADAVVHVLCAEAQTLAQRKRLLQAPRDLAAVGRVLLRGALHARDADERGQAFEQFVRVRAEIRFAIHKHTPLV